MKITKELLQRRHASADQVAEFSRLYRRGCEPDIEVLTALAAEGLDPWWLVHLLAPRDAVRYAHWCASQVPQGPAGKAALALVERWLAGEPVTTEDLRRAAETAWEAWEVVWATVRAAEGSPGVEECVKEAAVRAAEVVWATVRAAEGSPGVEKCAEEAAVRAAVVAAFSAAREAQLACLAALLAE